MAARTIAQPFKPHWIAVTTWLSFPTGVYRIGRTLRIGSRTRLDVHPQAHLFLADHAGVDAGTFLLTNRNHDSGNQEIRVEGGIWDGNNPGNPRGPDAPGSYTGVLINFSNVDGLTLRGLTLRDPESYFIRLGKVSRFLIEDLVFQIRHLRPNQDGVHVSGHCRDGIVRHLRGDRPLTPNDDMVALLADDALQRAQNLGAYNGPIRNLRIEDLQADSCHSFIRLLSFQNPIEDVEINNVRGGCRCCAINMDACRDCAVKLFDEADYPHGVGRIERVRVQGMHVFKASDHTHQPLLDFRTRVHDFVIEDFRRDAMHDISPNTPTLRVAKAGEVALVLEGVTASQFVTQTAGKAIAESMDVPELTAMRSVHPQKYYRAKISLASDESVTLMRGGFDTLRL